MVAGRLAGEQGGRRRHSPVKENNGWKKERKTCLMEWSGMTLGFLPVFGIASSILVVAKRVFLFC